MTRNLLRALARVGLVRRLGGFFLRNRATIWMAHRFVEPGSRLRGHDVSSLAAALELLRKDRTRIVGLREVLETGLGGGDVSKMVAFTVDDGSSDFYHLAAPVFERYDCPVTVFLPTGFIDGQGWLWWDRLSRVVAFAEDHSVVVALGDREVPLSQVAGAGRRRGERSLVESLSRMGHRERDQVLDRLERDLELSLPTEPPAEFAPLSWDQIRELGSRGVTFGPHGVTHSNLAALTPEEVRWEIAHSWERVNLETDAAVPVFCYPYGRTWSVPRDVSEVFEEAGLLGAVTAEGGHVSLSQVSQEPFALPRFGWPASPLEVRNITSGLVWAHRILVPKS